MEADEIIVSEEANAVADRLLGGNPGGDSERVEQFFNQAAHIHGRGLGFSSERSSRGTILPASALVKSLKRGRIKKLNKHVDDHQDSGERAAGQKQDGSEPIQQASSDDDNDEEEDRPGTDRKGGHASRVLTKQDLFGALKAAGGSSKRKRKRQKAAVQDRAM